MMLQKMSHYCVFLLFFNAVYGQNYLNVNLLAQINRGDSRYSGCWAYVAPDGSEYALLGAKTGTAAYPADDLANPVEAGFVPGPETNWREITVIGHHAFVVTDVQDTGHAMQVIDLNYLPDSLHLVTSYTETFTTGHIIQKNFGAEEPYVYVMGTSTSQGVHILDVSNPASPVEVGLYAPGYYIHDAHIRGHLLFACAFYETKVDILNISDKTNPVLIGVVTYDGKNTHSASTTEDGRFLILADEADGFPAHIFNIEDLNNPVEVNTYTANTESLVHNPYVRGDFCFVSHNTEGLRVLDIADPALPVEVGFYDTWPGPSGGFAGLWSACPYFPSGKIIGGNREDGLYVWAFNGTKAARIYGQITDSLTGIPLDLATVWLNSASNSQWVPVEGQGTFKVGVLAGTYTVQVEAENYFNKTLEINLIEGDSVQLDIRLLPETTSVLQLNKEAAMKIYPNPASDFLVVKIQDAAFFQLLDAWGATVQEIIFTSPEMEIPVQDLVPGNYHLLAFDRSGNLLAQAPLTIL